MKTKDELIATITPSFVIDLTNHHESTEQTRKRHLLYIDPNDGLAFTSAVETPNRILLHNFNAGRMKISNMVEQIELQYDIIVANIKEIK